MFLVVLNGAIAILLLGVGGLLLMLHLRLRQFEDALVKSPLLADSLTSNLVRAKATLAQLSTAMSERGPGLERDVKKAEDALQDLDFVLARADKVLNRLDNRIAAAEEAVENALQQPAMSLEADYDIEEVQDFLRSKPKRRQPPEVEQEPEEQAPAPQPQQQSNVVSPAVLAHRRIAAAYDHKRRRSVGEEELRRALEERL